MLGIIFKYFFIIICSIYIFIKLQDKSFNMEQIIIHLSFSTICSFVTYFTRKYFTYLTLIIIAFFLIIFLRIIYKKLLNITIIFTLISVGISYISYTISSFIIAPVCYVIFCSLNPKILTTVSFFMIGLLQIILCYLIFRIKRFRKGIAAYESKLMSDLGAFISISLLLLASLFNEQNSTDIIKTIILFSVMLVGLLLLLWWKKYFTSIYLEKIYKRNIEILENELFEQKERNKELKRQNEELSKIIHKDNKIIPAMELAVEEILNCQSADEQKNKSKSLLNHLKTLSSERTGFITEYEVLNKHLPKTGLSSLDASLNYLLNKASKNNVSFDLSVTVDLNLLTPDVVTEDDLNTLVLDLGENAIIATANMNPHNILVVMGLENQSFCINIYDSGHQFESSVIINLGLKRVTTHKKTGGNGIGLITTFDIIKKYNASFILDETIKNENYCKKVSVCFDGYKEFRIRTQRTEILNIQPIRKDIIFN